jgi:hypothetical protein
MSSNLVVNTGIGTINAPAGIAENISTLYPAGQTITQTILLNPTGTTGSQYSSPVGFSQITINPSGTVILTAQKGTNNAYINLNVNQLTTIDDTVSGFQITNSSTVSVAVNLVWIVATSTTTPLPGIVTSVNGLTGAVNLSASSLTGLAVVAQTGNYNDLLYAPNLAVVATSGQYNDLLNKPTIPQAPVNADWNAVNGLAQILNKPTLAPVATQGTYASLTQRPNFAVVATSGSYDDLVNTPAFAAVATSGNYSDLNGRPALAAVALSGQYSDLLNAPAAYNLPIATAGQLGGIKVGTGLNIQSGVLNVAPATSSAAGGVKPGTNITIAADGTISAINNVAPSFTYSELQVIGNTAGTFVYVSNGRKVGETAGNGTGVMAYWSAGYWRVFSTDNPVQS